MSKFNDKDPLLQSIRKLNILEKEDLENLGQQVDEEGNVSLQPNKNFLQKIRDQFNFISDKKKNEKGNKPKKYTIRKLIATLILLAPSSPLQAETKTEGRSEENKNNVIQLSTYVENVNSFFNLISDDQLSTELSLRTDSEFIADLLTSFFPDLSTQVFTGRNSEYQPGFGQGIPENNPVLQAEWWKAVDDPHHTILQLSLETVRDAPNLLLQTLQSGDIVFLQTPVSAYGHNTFSHSFIIEKNDGEVFFVSVRNHQILHEKWEDVVARLYTLEGMMETEEYFIGTNENTSLKILLVHPQQLLNRAAQDGWFSARELQLPLPRTESETSPPTNVQSVTFYGGLRGWGGLSRNDESDEITEAEEFVANFWSRFEHVKESLQLSDEVIPHMDLIVMNADGRFSSTTNDVLEELLTGETLPELTFSFRIPANWTMSRCEEEITHFLTHKESTLNQALLRQYVHSGGTVGITLDFEVLALEKGPVPANSINTLYQRVMLTFRNDILGGSFDISSVPFYVYDMSYGGVISELDQLMNGITTVDMSISGSQESKHWVLERMSRARNSEFGVMLFYSEYAPYLEIQQHVSDEGGFGTNFIDRELDDFEAIHSQLYDIPLGDISLFFQ